MPYVWGMTNKTEQKCWLREDEAAAILSLVPGTLRNWRLEDRRAGRGTPENPGRGGLIWRQFGRSVRYLRTGPLAPFDAHQGAEVRA